MSNKFVLLIAIIFCSGLLSAQTNNMLVRIAEIDVYPEHLSAYKNILKEEAAASLKLEPGVLSIFPMYLKTDTTQIKIVEIYADSAAYKAHLQSPHFLHYKKATLKMVKSLKLVDMEAIDVATMPIVFRKMDQ